MTHVWFNGARVTGVTAPMSLTDPGLLVADGLFETLAVYNGRVFALEKHLARLQRSSTALGLPEWDEAALRDCVAHAADAAKDAPVARLRITLWRSTDELGLFPAQSTSSWSVAVAPGAGPEVGLANEQLARVGISGYVRNERSPLAGHKSTSYAENIHALRHAQNNGFTEALLLNTQGECAEGTTTNVVIEFPDELVTPPVSAGALPGVTLEIAREVAAEHGISLRAARAGELTPENIADHPMALLGTLRNVQQVAQLDGQPIPRGTKLTRLSDLFAQEMHHYLS